MIVTSSNNITRCVIFLKPVFQIQLFLLLPETVFVAMEFPKGVKKLHLMAAAVTEVLEIVAKVTIAPPMRFTQKT